MCCPSGMASRHLLSFFVFSILLFWFVSSSHSLEDDAAAAKYTSQKVTLSLYYESLCPYCANFIVNKLVQVFNTDLYTIVNLKMVPWGNSEIQGTNHTITCQVTLFPSSLCSRFDIFKSKFFLS